MKVDKRIHDFENKTVSQLLKKFFWPAFTAIVIQSLYNIVDRIFIGQGIDSLALSGITAVFPVMLIQIAFGMLVGTGAGVRISINLGKKYYKQAEKVLGSSIMLALFVSVLITALGLAIKDPLLRWFGAQEQTITYANDYLNIILWGSVLPTLGYSLNSIIRAEGNAKMAMYSVLITSGVNIILDPIFIFVFDMGVKGVAWATIIAQFIQVIWVLSYFISKKSTVKLKLKYLKLDKKIVWFIISIGFAPFSMQIGASVLQALLNNRLAFYGGDKAIAVMGIIYAVSMILFMAIVSLSNASQPLFGYYLGSKQYDKIKETLVKCLVISTIIASVCWTFIEIFPEQVILLFNNSDPELVAIGVPAFRKAALLLPIMGFQLILSSYYQAIGKPFIAVTLILLRMFFFLIPSLYIMSALLGLEGVWYALPVSDSLAFGISVVAFVFEMHHLNKKIALMPIKNQTKL